MFSASVVLFFFCQKEKNQKKRALWAIAPRPKGAALRVVLKLVTLFVCAGTAAQVLCNSLNWRAYFLSGSSALEVRT